MAKISLAGFKDPVRRPRFIIWTGVIVLLLAAFVVVALGATSTRWFCAQVCHKVQDDTIASYEASSHSEISCMACHEPVNANTVVFLLAKMKALGELYTTVTNKYELPLNAGSALSLNKDEMASTQCTQCHTSNRKITPSAGIIIDHKVHADKGVTCTTCHNRVAHNEVAAPPKLLNVNGTPNKAHPNFMKMDACFRCHDVDGKKQAPGACAVCHPSDFNLVPQSHADKAWFPKGHAEAADEAYKKVAEEGAEAKKLEEEGVDKNLAEPVNYCSTCHSTEKFCTACHGMEMPHSEAFKTKEHPAVAKKSFDKCVMCHEPDKTQFCNDCHHGKKVDWTYNKAVPWQKQHAQVVSKNGFEKCLGACHEQKFCFDCHTKLKPFPSSHKAKTWLHRSNIDPAAKDLAIHAKTAMDNVKGCELCHGAGGANASFCKACHKYEMPHPAEFKQFHAKTGRADKKQCAFCHTFPETCSNCHHVGSSVKVPWQSLHGASVMKNGGDSCFAKCHTVSFCSACHTKLKVLPASHKGKGWTHRAALNTPAGHPAAYQANGAICGYCHGSGDAATNKFCMGCHKLAMPHPDGFGSKDDGGAHAQGFKDKKLSKAVCANCHTTAFCNGCHHNYTGSLPWLKQHPNVVKSGDPAQCFAKCHKETFCSYCHVRLIH